MVWWVVTLCEEPRGCIDLRGDERERWEWSGALVTTVLRPTVRTVLTSHHQSLSQ